MNKMGGFPEMVYTDAEGSFMSKTIQDYFNRNNIEHLITNTHAGTVERLIRTIKDCVHKKGRTF